MPGQLDTLGYGNLQTEAFHNAVPDGAIIVDVRRAPACKWNQGYNKAELQRAFTLRGMLYISLPRLGNPYHTLKEFKEHAAELFAQRDINATLNMIVEWLKLGRTVVLLCAEKDHRRCHRDPIAAELATRISGLAVLHLEVQP